MNNQAVYSQEQNPFDLPISNETMFSNYKNVYKKSIEKRQRKLLNKIAFINNFLSNDETILIITTGCSPMSFIEQFLTGWIVFYLKRSLLVFTNKRIFHIPTKRDYSYRNSIAHILYSDCKSIQIKGRKLIVEYKNGTTDKFLYIASKEKKKIKTVLNNISLEGSTSKTAKRTHLCPRCTKELEEDKYSCVNCHLEFKEKDEGKKISIIFPGGGYFYTRHWFLGIGDAIVETILLIAVILSLVDVINGVEGADFNLVMFAILLAIEKLITIYHCNHFIKEYIPKEKDIKFIA